MFGFISKKKLIGGMTLKQAFFILRHGSAEGNHKYLEAVKVIEDEYNRQKQELDLAKQAIIALTEERMTLEDTQSRNEVVEL